jgi:cytochrome c oxidase subunit I+III
MTEARPSSISQPRGKALRLHRSLAHIWGSDQRFRGWLTTNNNNDIGNLFLIVATSFFVIGGILAMLIRAQLATPDSAFMEPQVYSQIFTMHGTVMMFLFAIPFFEAMSMLLLPGMLGTRDLAFPRLGAYGLWVYIFGGSAVIIAMLMGLAPDGGWFMYPPLSSAAFSPGIGADVWLLGITSIEVSAIATAIEVIVTVLRYRAAGMSLSRMPIFAWYILVVSVMILTAFPPMILGSLLLEVERALNWPFFQVENGGDPLLWQHLFWLFGHPEVYIIFLPAAGMIATILPVMARTNLLGYGWVAGRAQLWALGPPHVHDRHSAYGARVLFSGVHARRGADFGHDFFLDWHFVERPRPDGIADALDHGVLRNLRDRRADRGDAGGSAV